MSCSDKEAGSITLPEQDDVFRNLKNAKRFAIDIGMYEIIFMTFSSIISCKRGYV